jgi:hypothetical protein
MKKLFSLITLCILSISVFSQETAIDLKKKELAAAQAELAAAQAKINGIKADITALTPPVYWKKGGFSSLNFNTLGLSNWAAGGVSSNAVTAMGNAYANYKKDKIEWVNNLDLAYGLIQNRGETFRKNEDKIDFLTKYGRRATEKLNYTVLGNFRSQFAPGYDFSNTDVNRPVISRFLAPAFVLASIGMDYKVTDYLSIYASPATGKFTIVRDDSIAAANIYIPSTEDAAGDQYYNNNFRAEFGALVNAVFVKDLTKKMNLRSTVNLFNNFTDKNAENRKNIDVDWQTILNMKLTQYIGASLFTHVIYDNDINVPLYDKDNNAILNGSGLPDSGPRTQFKRLLGIGFSYKF